VASFFLSRVDSALDPVLANKQPELAGKIAIANAKLAYQHFKEIFEGPRFAALKQAGAQPQRLLWASTGTKNPDYSELLYVETLIGPQTVNTMPPATYKAFQEHGTVAPTLETDVAEAKAQIKSLANLSIDLKTVTDQLEEDGVAIFAKAFDNLLQHIEHKARDLAA
jgi:transaldolase